VKAAASVMTKELFRFRLPLPPLLRWNVRMEKAEWVEGVESTEVENRV
jgi:hypothetical protein